MVAYQGTYSCERSATWQCSKSDNTSDNRKNKVEALLSKASIFRYGSRTSPP